MGALITIITIPILILLFFGSVILPWLNKTKISLLRDDIERLQNGLSEPESEPEPEPELDSEPEPITDVDANVDAKTKIAAMSVLEKKSDGVVAEDASSDKKIETETIVKSTDKPTMEQQFGARLPVWLGGIALALSGIFLVKYSIENNLVTPEMRVMISGLFGIIALFVANWIRKRPAFANGVRISQSLSGAGIAILYASLFAATSLYHIIPSTVGFAGMAGVTVMAIFLSLLYGPPIALLGLLGGFLTPALINSADPSAPLLFGYLYFIFAGLMLVIRQQDWWKLSFVAVFGSFMWVLLWVDTGWSVGDGLWLGLFLLAVTGTTILATWNMEETDKGKICHSPLILLNYLSFGGAVVLMAFVLDQADFGTMEWGMFGLLAAGSIVLAWLKPHVYNKAPYISLVSSLLLLMVWSGVEGIEILRMILMFVAIYVGAGYTLMWKTDQKALWAKISCFSALGYYILAYLRLYAGQGSPDFGMTANVWGGIAIVLAVAVGCTLLRLQKLDGIEDKEREELQSVFALTVTAFISLAVVIILDQEWWSAGIAAEVLAVAWVNKRVSIPRLRRVALGLAIFAGMLLIPQMLILFTVMTSSLVAEVGNVDTLTHMGSLTHKLFMWPLFQIGLPGLFFIGAGHLLRQRKEDRFVVILEWSGLMLMASGVYYMIRQLFHPDMDFLSVQAGFVERGVVTSMLFALALASLTGRRLLERSSYAIAGVTFLVLAVFRVYYFDLSILNPVWVHQNVGDTPVFNALWLTYALPIGWAYLCRREIIKMDAPEFLQLNKTMLILLIAFISLQVRQFYHEEYLDIGMTTDAEIYTYSVAWLLTGIGMLTAGIIRRDKLMRYAALGILTLAVAKVFLYDTSALEGLYRVFSFFGLGVSLIGISYVYTRFVLRE